LNYEPWRFIYPSPASLTVTDGLTDGHRIMGKAIEFVSPMADAGLPEILGSSETRITGKFVLGLPRSNATSLVLTS